MVRRQTVLRPRETRRAVAAAQIATAVRKQIEESNERDADRAGTLGTAKRKHRPQEGRGQSGTRIQNLACIFQTQSYLYLMDNIS